MDIMAWVAVFLVSFLITNFLVPNILLASLRKRLIDIPNKRKVHTVTSSRLGGVSFYPSIIVSVCLTVTIGMWLDTKLMNANVSMQFMLTSCACFIMYIIGLFDDVVGVRYRTKFMVQGLAALLIVSSGVWINNLHGFCGVYDVPAWIGVPFSMLLLVYIMNAVNLIDGIDGLASGLSMVALIVYGFYFIEVGEMAKSLVAFASLGCLLAFFRYNVSGFHHRTLKIFMGDTGSLVVGTILGICAVKLTQVRGHAGYENYPLLMAYSVLVVPCFDVLRVMISRRRRGKSMFLPDKSHIHHKLLALGLSSRRSLITILLISVSFITMNAVLDYFIALEWIVLVDIVVFTWLNMYISKKIADKERE